MKCFHTGLLGWRGVAWGLAAAVALGEARSWGGERRGGELSGVASLFAFCIMGGTETIADSMTGLDGEEEAVGSGSRDYKGAMVVEVPMGANKPGKQARRIK